MPDPLSPIMMTTGGGAAGRGSHCARLARAVVRSRWVWWSGGLMFLQLVTPI
jgi:hypothetical protein